MAEVSFERTLRKMGEIRYFSIPTQFLRGGPDSLVVGRKYVVRVAFVPDETPVSNSPSGVSSDGAGLIADSESPAKPIITTIDSIAGDSQNNGEAKTE